MSEVSAGALEVSSTSSWVSSSSISNSSSDSNSQLLWFTTLEPHHSISFMCANTTMAATTSTTNTMKRETNLLLPIDHLRQQHRWLSATTGRDLPFPSIDSPQLHCSSALSITQTAESNSIMIVHETCIVKKWWTSTLGVHKKLQCLWEIAVYMTCMKNWSVGKAGRYHTETVEPCRKDINNREWCCHHCARKSELCMKNDKSQS